MDNLRPADLVTDFWSTYDCPGPRKCPYVTSDPTHVHERHVDGSLAVVAWPPSGQFVLLEFQDVLDW